MENKNSDEIIVKFDEVTKQYGDLIVLDKLNLDIKKNEMVSIIGPSGSGKTTVLRVLMTLEKINGGVIHLDGEPLTHMNSNNKLVEANDHEYDTSQDSNVLYNKQGSESGFFDAIGLGPIAGTLLPDEYKNIGSNVGGIDCKKAGDDCSAGISAHMARHSAQGGSHDWHYDNKDPPNNSKKKKCMNCMNSSYVNILSQFFWICTNDGNMGFCAKGGGKFYSRS